MRKLASVAAADATDRPIAFLHVFRESKNKRDSRVHVYKFVQRHTAL